MLLLHNEGDEERIGCAIEIKKNSLLVAITKQTTKRKEALLCKIGRGFLFLFFFFPQHSRLHKPSLRFNSLVSFLPTNSKSPKPPSEANNNLVVIIFTQSQNTTMQETP